MPTGSLWGKDSQDPGQCRRPAAVQSRRPTVESGVTPRVRPGPVSPLSARASGHHVIALHMILHSNFSASRVPEQYFLGGVPLCGRFAGTESLFQPIDGSRQPSPPGISVWCVSSNRNRYPRNQSETRHEKKRYKPKPKPAKPKPSKPERNQNRNKYFFNGNLRSQSATETCESEAFETRTAYRHCHFQIVFADNRTRFCFASNLATLDEGNDEAGSLPAAESLPAPACLPATACLPAAARLPAVVSPPAAARLTQARLSKAPYLIGPPPTTSPPSRDAIHPRGFVSPEDCIYHYLNDCKMKPGEMWQKPKSRKRRPRG